jgi:hypothetical protein
MHAPISEKSPILLQVFQTQLGGIGTSQKRYNWLFFNYFHNLFTSEIAGDLQNCVENLSCRVTEDMNRALLKPFL